MIPQMQLFVKKIRLYDTRATRAIVSIVVIIAGLAFLLIRYDFNVVGTAVMRPSIGSGETVAVASGSSSNLGDVVQVRAWDDVVYTVRVIGRSGDTVECCGNDGRLMVNGQPLTEKYAYGDTATFGTFSVKIPAGRIFVLGDARSISVDSRSHLDDQQGTLPESAIQGRAASIAWPVWKIRPVNGMVDFLLFIVVELLVLAGLVSLIVISRPALARAGVWLGSLVRRRKSDSQLT